MWDDEQISAEESPWERVRYKNGKSFTKYTYTNQDIAEATGLKVETIQKHIRAKRFNPKSLISTFRYMQTVITLKGEVL